MSSGPAQSPRSPPPVPPRGWTALRCPGKCPLPLYLVEYAAHTHTHTHYWSQTWQLPRAMLNKAHGACSPKSKKVSGWNYALNYTALAPVGRSELVCGDSLICQTSTGWVTTSTPRGQRGWRYLPPANWKAELRVSREQTKKKRRMKRRGILDVFTRSCCILFGLCGELSAQKQQQQQQPGRRLASQCALNLE